MGSFFFEILGLPDKFLQTDPVSRPEQLDYLEAKRIVCSLKVVNDVAERAIHLMQKYNGKLTTNEES